MKIKQLGKYCLVGVGMAVVLAGCVTQPPVSPSEQYKPATEAGQQDLVRMKQMKTLPDMEHISQRYSFYEKRLGQWQAVEQRLARQEMAGKRSAHWGECGAALSELVEGYAALRSQYAPAKKGVAVAAKLPPRDPWDVHRLDIDYLEKGCDAVLEKGAAEVGGVPADQAEAPAELLVRYAAEGKYEEAIEVYRDLSLKTPKLAATPRLKKIYGMALLRTRRIEAAIQVLPQAVEKLDKTNPDSWGLRRLVADLYLATGKLKQAEDEYRAIYGFISSFPLDNDWNGVDLWVNDQLQLFKPSQSSADEQGLNIFMTVMRSFILFDGKQLPESLTNSVQRLERIFPASKYTKRSQQILWQAEDQVRSWVRGQLYEVDSLVGNQEYEKALALLDTMLDQALPAELRSEIKKVRDDVILADARAKKVKDIKPEALAGLWSEASNLLTLHRHDEALEIFKLLLGSEYDARAREKIIEASDTAAKQMRRQAAAIFVQAKRADTLERKKEMLAESWQMLGQISTKYPMSSILEKVLQNMQVIENEMNEISPSLLEEVKSRPPVSADGEAENPSEGVSQKIVEEEIM